MKKGQKHTEESRKRLSKSAKKRIGNKNSNWRGGRRIVDGYAYIYSPNHPNKTKDKCVVEHRLVMENHLGRTLLPTEVVHHINGNRLDNRIENLMLFSSPGKHSSACHVRRDSKGEFIK